MRELEISPHVSQPIRSVLSSERDLVLCGEAGLGGLLMLELLEAVECRGESESCTWGERGGDNDIMHPFRHSGLAGNFS